MFACRLCGLLVEAIPEDAVLIGKLHRFVDGSFHFLRKKLAPRTGPRPRKNRNPDQEAPQEPPPIGNEPSGITVAFEIPARLAGSFLPENPPPAMGSHARDVPPLPPMKKEKQEKPEKKETEPTETVMERAFRLIGTYTEKQND